MAEPIDNEFKLLLARAFDLAWEQFYGPDNSGPLPEDVARPELAKFLVDMAKSGVREENAPRGGRYLALGGAYNGSIEKIDPPVSRRGAGFGPALLHVIPELESAAHAGWRPQHVSDQKVDPHSRLLLWRVRTAWSDDSG